MRGAVRIGWAGIGASWLLAAVAAASPAPDGWGALAQLAWGDGAGQLGLHEGADDELAYGPHGVAVGADGTVAVIDRVHRRALLFDADGRTLGALTLPGRPGAAAVIDVGTVAVLDERSSRMVRVVGDVEASLVSPPWAMAPSALTVLRDADGRAWLEAVDAFQLRQPLVDAGDELARLELSRGWPSPDGRAGATAVRRGDALRLQLGEVGLELLAPPWPRGAGAAWMPGEARVLAFDGHTAWIALEARSAGAGPLEVRRSVVAVSADGAVGEPVTVPAPGWPAVPAPLAASPDGRVVALGCDEAGCTVWTTDVSAPVAGGGGGR